MEKIKNSNFNMAKKDWLMLRCINAKTKQYVDVIAPKSTGMEIKKLLLENADILSGNWNGFTDKRDKVEYDYYFMFQPKYIKKEEMGGDRKHNILKINTETFEIVHSQSLEDVRRRAREAEEKFGIEMNK